MSASRTMSSARVEPTSVSSTFSAISASRNARQALRDDGRVLVGEVEDLDAVLAVQAGDLGGELLRVAMAPARPEAALAAVVAQMRAAARELHDDRALAAPIAVARVVDQLPADAVSVEIADDGRRRRRDGLPFVAKRDARNGAQRFARVQRPRQLRDRRLALAAHDDVDLRLGRQHLAPVIGREDAAVDDPDRRQRRPEQARQLGDDRMGRGRAGMAEQNDVGRDWPSRVRTISHKRHRAEFGVEQLDVRGRRRSAARRWTGARAAAVARAECGCRSRGAAD